MSACTCGGGDERTDAGTATDGAVRIDAGPAIDASPLTDAGPADETADPEQFLAAFMEEACEVGRRCEAAGATSSICHPDYPSYFWDMALAAWRAGRATFDREAARACLAEMRAPDRCFVPQGLGADPPPLVCFDVIVGTGTVGSPCSDGLGQWSPECADDLTCVNEGACPGRCAPKGVAGDSCDQLRVCGREFRCREGTCIAAGSLGDACDPEPCQYDFVCSSGTCRAGAVGDPCVDDSHCVYPNRCSPETSFCEAWYGMDDGDPCEGSYYGCNPPFVCSGPDVSGPGIEHTCVPGAALGATCDEIARCAAGGRCVDGTCREIVAPGGACDADRVCPETFDCIDGSCVPRPSVGDACPGLRCAFANCDDGRCVPHDPLIGDECNNSLYYCAIGLRCTNEGTRFVCTERCP